MRKVTRLWWVLADFICREIKEFYYGYITSRNKVSIECKPSRIFKIVEDYDANIKQINEELKKR